MINEARRKTIAIVLSFLQYLPNTDTTKNVPGRMISAQNQYLFQVSLPVPGYNTYYFEARCIYGCLTLELSRNLIYL
jgi:hypothetical protein